MLLASHISFYSQSIIIIQVSFNIMGLNELYNSIVDDVVENVKEAFSEEGVDEQILKSLKEAWLRRIRESQQPRQNTQQQLQLQQQQQSQSQSQPQNHQQPQHLQQTSVIVYNNSVSNSSNISNNKNYNNLQTQPPRSNDNLNTSTALNLSQHHRQQAVDDLTGSNQRTQHHGDKTNINTPHLPQLDGSNGISDDDENDDESDGDFPDGDDDVDVSDEEDKETDTNREDEDPLNSGDDVSNDESSEMFETDNVVVCQYDKITRNRNKWKFHLKDGIMNINGRDYVFQKAVGDAEW